ncbi:MAG: hypothetical protein WHT27_05565 [candidate division WOR-3 bacterium]|jgi:hypothetical protein
MSRKKISLFIFFVLANFIYADLTIFYPGSEEKSEPFNHFFIFNSSSLCSLIIKDITDFNDIGKDVLIYSKPFLKIDVSDKNYIVLDTFFYLSTKKSFAWYLESYENGVIERSNILFFNTGHDNIFYEVNQSKDEYLSLIFKIFGIAGFYPTGRVWVNGVEVDLKELNLYDLKNIRWKTKK